MGSATGRLFLFFSSRRIVFFSSFSVECIVGMFRFLCNITPKSFAWSTFSNVMDFCSFLMFVFQFFNESNFFIGFNFSATFVSSFLFTWNWSQCLRLPFNCRHRWRSAFFFFFVSPSFKQNMNGKHEWTTQIKHLILGRATKKKQSVFSLNFRKKMNWMAKIMIFFFYLSANICKSYEKM